MPKGGRRNRRRKQSGNATDALQVNSMKLTGASTSFPKYDLVLRRQNMNLVQTPPKQIGNQIYWIKEIYSGTFQASTTTYVENNLQFQLSSLTDASSLAAVFDQYCIYSVTLNLSLDGNQTNPGLMSVSGVTAIDYDNIATIGPSGIIGYSTSAPYTINNDSSHCRFVRPCIAIAGYTGSFGGFLTARMWCNSSSTNIVHYGIRNVVYQNNVAVVIRTNLEFVVGFRNKW